AVDFRGVLLLDSVHASYTGDGEVQTTGLEPFVRYADRAARGGAPMVVTHSSIVPPGYASTREVADYLLARIETQRAYGRLTPVRGVETKTVAERGSFYLRGTSGSVKEAHCAHLQMLPELFVDRLLTSPP
ncbi:MAG: hypothetical protein AAGA56_25290, partial [Myxococcota bacterium]